MEKVKELTFIDVLFNEYFFYLSTREKDWILKDFEKYKKRVINVPGLAINIAIIGNFIKPLFVSELFISSFLSIALVSFLHYIEKVILMKKFSMISDEENAVRVFSKVKNQKQIIECYDKFKDQRASYHFIRQAKDVLKIESESVNSMITYKDMIAYYENKYNRKIKYIS